MVNMKVMTYLGQVQTSPLYLFRTERVAVQDVLNFQVCTFIHLEGQQKICKVSFETNDHVFYHEESQTLHAAQRKISFIFYNCKIFLEKKTSFTKSSCSVELVVT